MDLVLAATAKSGTGEVVIDRDYEITEPVRLFDQVGYCIRGTEGRRPILHWTGSAEESALFDFANCRDTMIRNVIIHVHGSLRQICHYWRKVKGRTTPTNNGHRSVATLVQPSGSLSLFSSHDRFNERWEAAGLPKEENNEFGYFEDIDVDGALAGIQFDGQQSHGHVLRRCRLNVHSTAVMSTGWFSATDVSGSGCACAFWLQAVSAPVHIVRPNFEATQRLLVAQGSEGFTGDSQAITIEGGSTRCDQLNLDGRLIILQNAGPLRIVGHQFGSGQQPIPTIESAHPGAVTLLNCDFGCHGSFWKPIVKRPDGSRDLSASVIGCVSHSDTGEVAPYVNVSRTGE